MKLQLDLTSDIKGLEKKFNIESVQFFPKLNRVSINGQEVYVTADGRELQQNGATIEVGTDPRKVGSIEGEEISIKALSAIVPIVQEFYKDRSENPIDNSVPGPRP